MSFDLTVHKRDKKGRIVEINAYKMKVVDGVRTFERPVGSGVWYYETGEPVKKEASVEQKAQKEVDVDELLPKVETKSKGK